MKTTRIYQLNHLTPGLFRRLEAAQKEAAQVWNVCTIAHKAARQMHTKWPGRNDLQQATKGHYALHSQSVQMIVHAFLANIATTRELRQKYPHMRTKYPWRTKHFYPVHWPAQAVHKEKGRVVLPMGRGRASLALPIDLPSNAGACVLVWNHGFELHVSVEVPQANTIPGNVRATVDLGEIHLAAVTTSTSKALMVTGRGIRSLKRQRSKQFGQLAKKQSRCKKYSRRWKRLQLVKRKMGKRVERRIRDQRHKATKRVVNFCIANAVGTLFIGNPHGVRLQDKGRHHNQRMALWEYGKDIDYLTYKATQARIMCFTGSERGTSSRCPACGRTQKPRGRNWVCRNCGFRGHRDLVGSINMHELAFGQKVKFPRSFTYLRPGPLDIRKRSSRAGTPQRCLSKSTDQPRLLEAASSETGHTVDAVQKPATL
jgi:putative transposase